MIYEAFIFADGGDELGFPDEMQPSDEHSSFVNAMESTDIHSKKLPFIPAEFLPSDGSGFSDIYPFDGYVCCSDRSRPLFQDNAGLEILKINNIQNVPDFDCEPIGTYFLLHFLKRLELQAGSIFETFPGTQSPSSIDHMVLRSKDVGLYPFFQIMNNSVQVFCTENFKQQFQNAGFTGIEFKPISSELI